MGEWAKGDEGIMWIVKEDKDRMEKEEECRVCKYEEREKKERVVREWG